MEENYKEDFERWYIKQDYCSAAIQEFGEDEIIRHWLSLDIAFQWGVILEFFDSVGMYVNTCIQSEGFGYDILDDKRFLHSCDESMIRKEAQKAAFEKAIEIYETK